MRVFATIIGQKGKKLTFPVKNIETTIGRSSSAKVRIYDDLSSGLHAKIYLENDCVMIEDLKSKNGVFLNDIKVMKQRVYIGDIVRIGKSTLKIEDTKMSQEDIDAHVSKSDNRQNGSITLEVETFQEQQRRVKKTSKKQKDYVKNAKLYEGVEENNSKHKVNLKKLAVLDKVALLIDLFLSLFIGAIPLGYLFYTKKNFLNLLQRDISVIAKGDNLYFAIGSFLLFFIFFQWNRATGKSSIGEKIFGL